MSVTGIFAGSRSGGNDVSQLEVRPEYRMTCSYPSLPVEQQISAATFTELYLPHLLVHDRIAAGRRLRITVPAAGADTVLFHRLFSCCHPSPPLVSSFPQAWNTIEIPATRAAEVSSTQCSLSALRNMMRLWICNRKSNDEKRRGKIDVTELLSEKSVVEVKPHDCQNRRGSSMQTMGRWVLRVKCALVSALRGSQPQQRHWHEPLQHSAQDGELQKKQSLPAMEQVSTSDQQTEQLRHQSCEPHAPSCTRLSNTVHWQKEADTWKLFLTKIDEQRQKTCRCSWGEDVPQQQHPRKIGGRSEWHLTPFNAHRSNIVLVPIDVRPRHHAAAGQLPFTLLLPLDELCQHIQAFKQAYNVSAPSHLKNGVDYDADGASTHVYDSRGGTGPRQLSPYSTGKWNQPDLSSQSGTAGRERHSSKRPNASLRVPSSSVIPLTRVTRSKATSDEASGTLGLESGDAVCIVPAPVPPQPVSIDGLDTRMRVLKAGAAVDVRADAADPHCGLFVNGTGARTGHNTVYSNGSLARKVHSEGGCTNLVSPCSDTFTSSAVATASGQDAGIADIAKHHTYKNSSADKNVRPRLLKRESRDSSQELHGAATTAALTAAGEKGSAVDTGGEDAELASGMPEMSASGQTSTTGEGESQSDVAVSVSSEVDDSAEENKRRCLNALDIFVTERLLHLHRSAVRSSHILLVMLCRQGLDSSIATSLLNELRGLNILGEQPIVSYTAEDEESTRLWDSDGGNVAEGETLCAPADSAGTPFWVEKGTEIHAPGSVAITPDHALRGQQGIADEAAAATAPGVHTGEKAKWLGAPIGAAQSGLVKDSLCLKECGVAVVNLSGGLLGLQRAYFSSMPVV